MEILKLLLITALSSLLIGQLIRIHLFSGLVFTLTDILTLICLVFFLIWALFIKRKIEVPQKIIFFAVVFALWAFSTTVLAFNNFSIPQLVASLSFLARFLLYLSIIIIVYNIVPKSKIYNWLSLILTVGFVFALLGFIQIILFSDLTSLTYYGWDPHQKRIVSTFLDPNFAGIIYVIISIYSLTLFIFKKHVIYLALFTISFIALILTFSRSSYLAFLTTLVVIGIFKSKKIPIILVAVFIMVFLLIGQVRTRVIGAFTLDETAKARLESWQNALTIFADNPVFGVGFNTYRFTQAKYGYFLESDPLGGHSGAGSDSSVLLVAATTGIVGLFFYVCFLFVIFKTFLKKASSSPLHLGALATFIGLLVHSQFVNSLFFPQIMIILWFVLGLVLKNDR